MEEGYDWTSAMHIAGMWRIHALGILRHGNFVRQMVVERVHVRGFH